ncbi:MAG: M20/M25/M40 family metallo-hydrolase [Bdellovibrionales bacterium]|nr:M20/M25/M40 family metallo-hydrolase [Bdellovibrionales bacterium]
MRILFLLSFIWQLGVNFLYADEEHDLKAIQSLQKAIRFQTVSHDHSQMAYDEFNAFLNYLKETYPTVFSHYKGEVVEGYSLLLIPLKVEAHFKNYLFLAHYDVVPISAPKNWTVSPFAGEIKDGFLYGRGALDDKASLIACLEAMEAMLKNSHPVGANVYFAFGHDEEVAGNGARAMAARLKDLGLFFDLVLDEGGAIVEGSKLKVSGNLAMVGVAEKGFMVLKLSANEMGGHSSMPPEETSIEVLAKAVAKAHAVDFSTHLTDPVLQMLENLGLQTENPFKAFFLKNAKWFKPIITFILDNNKDTRPMIKTVKATTRILGGNKVNQLPQSAQAFIMFRTLPDEDIHQIKNRIESVIGDTRVTVEIMPGYSNPKQVSRLDTESGKKLISSIKKIYPDVRVLPYLTMAGTDSRSYAEISKATYRINPIEIYGKDLSSIHGHDERIKLSSFLNFIKFYKYMFGP